MVFVCTLCSQFAARTYLPVLSHIGSVHRFGATRRIECGIDGCPATYTTNTYESFRSHVYRKHRDVLYSQDSQINSQKSGISRGHNISIDMEDGTFTGMPTTPSSEETAGTSQPVDEHDEITLASALFQLKTLEERKVTQTTLNGIIGDVQALWDLTLSKIQQHIRKEANSTFDIGDLPSKITHPFQGLETDHQRQKFFKETLNYIVRNA